MIPVVDVKAQYLSMRDEIDSAVAEIIQSQNFIHGKWSREFGEELAKMHQARFGLGCANGSIALYLCLKAYGIGEGDEVITTPHTFIATASAIAHAGAKPVFVDICADTYCIDPDLIEEKITARTKAILPVHLYGNPAQMSKICAIAEQHHLRVIEDCAQSHLAKIDDKTVGSIGDSAAFSCFPAKILGAPGDAGAVTTNDRKTFDWMTAYINHGRTPESGKYLHEILGFNYRLDEFKAIVLQKKLKHLESWVQRRRTTAQLYDEQFRANGFKTMVETEGGHCAYYVHVCEVSNRNDLQTKLQEKGISTGVYFPIPLHLQPAFNYLGHKNGDFPRTEAAAKRVISVPLFPELSSNQIEYISSNFLESAIP